VFLVKDVTMPTYEYECKTCSHRFEVFQSMSDEPVKKCPECGEQVRRLISGGVGVIFKGSGFYVTDKDKSGAPKSAGSKKDACAKSDTCPKGGDCPRADGGSKGDGASEGSGASKEASGTKADAGTEGKAKPAA